MDEYGPDIVSVVDDDGNEHEFEVLDRIETDSDKKYIAMIPVFENDNDILNDDGELIILRVIETEEETVLEPIEDEDEFNEVGRIFEERLSEMFDFDGEEE
ncbi:MAG: DUF1292 domain-containing protein [Oscillospiraceae bacterium]|nr:DUF1292 domain-containing protein [Oscillospiraceae bacterium]